MLISITKFTLIQLLIGIKEDKVRIAQISTNRIGDIRPITQSMIIDPVGIKVLCP